MYDDTSHEKQIYEYEEIICHLKERNKNNPLWTKEELARLEKKTFGSKKKVYSFLKPWERVAICRHPKRPHSSDYLEHSLMNL